MKGRTLFDILRGKEAPQPPTGYNPIGAEAGNNISIDALDYRDDLWRVERVWSWAQAINGSAHNMADYVLRSDQKNCLLRVFPNYRPVGKLPISVLVMNQYFPAEFGPMPYDAKMSPDIIDALDDPTGEFYWHRGEPDEECYWRIGGKIPLQATMGPPIQRMTLWDFHRDTTDEGGSTFTQYLYAQLNGRYAPKTGTIEGGDKTLVMYRGFEIEPEKVTIYGAKS